MPTTRLALPAPLLLGCACALALTVTPVRAKAYIRQAVDGKPDTFLYWSNRRISYWVNERGCDDVPINETVGAIKRSFFTWASPSCTNVYFLYEGLIKTSKTNITLEQGKDPDFKNVLVWREEAWPPPGVTDKSVTADMLALTVLIYDVETGEIVDSDIDFNGHHYFWTAVEDKTKVTTDIQNVVTHEAGHILGLGHSERPEATMYAEMSQGELKKRALDEDDIAGVCFIYPYASDTPTGAGQPLPKIEVKGSPGCAVAADPSPVWLLLLSFLLVLRFRRSA